MKPFFDPKKYDFIELAHHPLVTCWQCGCSVRVVSNDGLCDLCQPVKRGKSSVKQKKEQSGENETVLITEINTDGII